KGLKTGWEGLEPAASDGAGGLEEVSKEYPQASDTRPLSGEGLGCPRLQRCGRHTPPQGPIIRWATGRSLAMRAAPPLRPAHVVKRLFMQEFLAAEPPCLALGLVEERQRLCGLLALRLDETIPPAIADRGFEFGHALLGNMTFAVLHLVLAFPGFQTYTVLINPNNLVVQAVLQTMLDAGDSFFLRCSRRARSQPSERTSVAKASPSCGRTGHASTPRPRRTPNISAPSRRSPPILIRQVSSFSGSV